MLLELVVIFALLTYTENKKMQKNKTNTDPNPTTNPNPKPTIDKAPKWKELNKVLRYLIRSAGFPVAKNPVPVPTVYTLW